MIHPAEAPDSLGQGKPGFTPRQGVRPRRQGSNRANPRSCLANKERERDKNDIDE
jgi:hypothetical protein